jgi:hypothetical protein
MIVEPDRATYDKKRGLLGKTNLTYIMFGREPGWRSFPPCIFIMLFIFANNG